MRTRPNGAANPERQAAVPRLPPLARSRPSWRLCLSDYRESGGLAQLLSDHADEVMAEVAPDAPRQKIVEHLFRALTDINAEDMQSAARKPWASCKR